MATRSASDSASAPLAASRSRGRSLAAMSLMRGLVVMTGGSFSTNCFRQRDKNVVQRSHPPQNAHLKPFRAATPLDRARTAATGSIGINNLSAQILIAGEAG